MSLIVDGDRWDTFGLFLSFEMVQEWEKRKRTFGELVYWKFSVARMPWNSCVSHRNQFELNDIVIIWEQHIFQFWPSILTLLPPKRNQNVLHFLRLLITRTSSESWDRAKTRKMLIKSFKRALHFAPLSSNAGIPDARTYLERVNAKNVPFRKNPLQQRPSTPKDFNPR